MRLPRPQKTRSRNDVKEAFFLSSCCIFMIDPHVAFAAPIEDENTDSEIVPPLAKGVRGI